MANLIMTSFTFRDIAFDVMNVEPWSYRFGQNDSQLIVTYQVAYANRFKAKDALLGKTTYAVNSAGDRPYLSRLAPHRWPEQIANVPIEVFCKNAAITGFETLDEADGNYYLAKLVATYQASQFDYLDDSQMIVGNGGVPDEADLTRMVDIGEPETEARIIHAFGLGAVYCNADDAMVSPGAPDLKRGVANGWPFPFHEETLSYTWMQVPQKYAPLQLASQMVNKINNAPFDVYSARTLMLVGRKPHRCTLPDMTRAYNIEYRFKYNPKKWDHLPDPQKNMAWYKVVSYADTSKILFEEADFKTLFRPILP